MNLTSESDVNQQSCYGVLFYYSIMMVVWRYYMKPMYKDVHKQMRSEHLSKHDLLISFTALILIISAVIVFIVLLYTKTERR